MILTVDIGNSNITLTLFGKEKKEHEWRIITDKKKSKDEYSMILKQLIKSDGVIIEDIKGIIMSSVVPELTRTFQSTLTFIENAKVMIIGDKTTKIDVNIKDGVEKEIGHDILMNIVAGRKRFKENFVIIDMGTATTFNIALKGAEYVGSVITVGANLSAEIVHERCSQLPLIEVKKPKHFMGTNTSNALQSGIYYGYLGLLKEIIFKIKESYKENDLKFYLTGGLSKVFLPDLEFVDGIFPDLTCEGLKETWDLNN